MSRVVCDASALVALLLDSGADGQWAARQLRGAELSAPQVLDFECANVIRRLEAARLISSDQAAQAHRDLLALPIERWPYALLADRVWQLRSSLSCYDASYVAVAELVRSGLVTLDRRIGRCPGLTCVVSTPEQSARAED